MSHFLEVKTTLKVQATLSAGLKNMGFEVEVAKLVPGLSESALRKLAIVYTNTYHKQQTAHVVARHALLRAKTTAIGLYWDTNNQVFTLQCDPYEIRNSDYGRQFGHVIGNDNGKPVVDCTYSNMNDDGILSVLQQQLQIEYNRAIVKATYSVLSETYVGTEIQFEAAPKATQVSLGAAVQRV